MPIATPSTAPASACQVLIQNTTRHPVDFLLFLFFIWRYQQQQPVDFLLRLLLDRLISLIVFPFIFRFLSFVSLIRLFIYFFFSQAT
jgi:hypothetical protein